MLLNKNGSPLYYDFDLNHRKSAMNVTLFHDRLLPILAELNPLLERGNFRDFQREAFGPKIFDMPYTFTALASATSEKLENYTGLDWPKVSPKFKVITGGPQFTVKRPDNTNWQCNIELVLALPLGEEVGEFAVYYSHWMGEYVPVIWTYVAANDLHLSAALAYTHGDRDAPSTVCYHLGNEANFTATAEYILEQLNATVQEIAEDPHTQRVLLNRRHAEGLYKFKQAEGWQTLPWISVNEDSERMGPMNDSALRWYKQGPFDQIALTLRNEDNTIVTSMSAITLHRGKVVQFFKFDPNTGAALDPTPDDVGHFWDALDQLTMQANRLLAEDL